MIKSKLKEMEGLADSEKVAYLKRESPETVNIINEFKTDTSPELRQDEQKYQQRKLRFNVLSSYSMNLCFYILLKLKEKNVQDHPVIQRIVLLKTQLNSLKTIHKMLEPQFNKILRKIEAGAELKPSDKTQNILKQNPNKSIATASTGSKMSGLQSKASTVQAKNGNGKALKKPTFEDYSSEEDSEIDDVVEGEEDEDESDDEAYYRQIKKIKEDKREKIDSKKKAKLEEMFQDDPTHHIGEDDVRGINRKILKNKGLTRKRKKIDRNSRVKLRKKFEKAEYKLKTKGIHYRTEKGHYDGEFTGVKAGLIKSRKLKEL